MPNAVTTDLPANSPPSRPVRRNLAYGPRACLPLGRCEDQAGATGEVWPLPLMPAVSGGSSTAHRAATSHSTLQRTRLSPYGQTDDAVVRQPTEFGVIDAEDGRQDFGSVSPECRCRLGRGGAT